MPDALDQAIQAVMPAYLTSTGHGHVWRRPDGKRWRCGGERLCAACRADAAALVEAREKVVSV